MINAQLAKKKTRDTVLSMTESLEADLQKVIEAAIAQGSCKATFYPRNQFQRENAVSLLTLHGYNVTIVSAKDQRDTDRVDINWS